MPLKFKTSEQVEVNRNNQTEIKHEDESDAIFTNDPEFSPLKPRVEPLVPIGPNSLIVGSESEKGLPTFKKGSSEDAMS